MQTDAQECTKMRMGKNPTTFGKKPHSTQFVGEDAFGSFKGATVKVVDLSKPVERADELVAGGEVVDCTIVRLFGGRLVVGVVLLESIRTPVKVGCALGVPLFDELSSHSAESANLPSTALTPHAHT